ncbi:exopolysaccharide Pel transporter PelG [Ralstonia mannitolilytica]|uniref:exopolysaccharide Pel transporter PelG n=1 Tax=Ralstonia mannitolilytica TaxID=105219 RepID=UPI0026F14AE3|nr:exopolysaccharide Pel transporter PelG [Ralstonia mannitolilytica]
MAGIGFELRKMLKRDSLLGLLRAYTYAGIISSGPWILSIVGILLIGILSLPFVIPGSLITQFQVSVTYLIAVSLILTGPLQLAFTRFTSDRLFEKRDDLILPNYHAVSLVMTLVAGGLGLLVILFAFPQQSAIYRLLMLAGFVVMANIWIAVIFLSGMKQYKAIVWIFLLGYTLTVLLALLFNRLGLEGLLLGFVTGQLCLLIGMGALIYRNFRGRRFLSFEVFDKRFAYPSLMLIGHEIVKIQAMAALVLFAVGASVLRALQISELYLPLLYVDTIAASLQVVFLGVVNIFFYLDRRRVVLALTAAFVVLNGVLTWITLQLGPAWYGYGFAVSLLLVVMASLVMLDRKLGRLEYETFMLQ